jgi:hypothetical protein
MKRYGILGGIAIILVGTLFLALLIQISYLPAQAILQQLSYGQCVVYSHVVTYDGNGNWYAYAGFVVKNYTNVITMLKNILQSPDQAYAYLDYAWWIGKPMGDCYYFTSSGQIDLSPPNVALPMVMIVCSILIILGGFFVLIGHLIECCTEMKINREMQVF